VTDYHRYETAHYTQTTVITMTTICLSKKVTIIKDKFCEFIYDMS